MGAMRSRRSILRWATRATCAAVGLSLAFACAPLLGIEDVTYGEFEGGGNGEGGNTLGEGGLDAAVDCGT